MQHLSQQQKLFQRLSPQQIQLMKLLQIPTVQLEERIKEEIEENPALEFNEDEDEPTLDEKTNEELASENEPQDDDGDDYLQENEDEFDNLNLTEYLSDEDDDYYFNGNTANEEEKQQYTQPQLEISFHEMLSNQIGHLNINEKEQRIVEFIIGSLDDDGYLRRSNIAIMDDLLLRQNIATTNEELQKLIHLVQQFEPAGICATSLQECLILQLRRKDNSAECNNALKILEKYFDEFTKKHYERIQRGLSLSEDEMRNAIAIITKLSPKPGELFETTPKSENYIIPDFFVQNQNGIIEIQLNSKNAPDLRVSNTFKEMLKEYGNDEGKNKQRKEAALFIKQKIDSAKWFIDAIKQRQETLYLTMKSIVSIQENFFLTGDESMLKPMILKDIADRTSLDISTISRVANSKFVQTEYGMYKLKFFFSEGLATDSGEEVSTREVKNILANNIAVENKRKPLSDEKLAEILQEKGYNIARRTVAKYREQLNIPVARLRKEF